MLAANALSPVSPDLTCCPFIHQGNEAGEDEVPFLPGFSDESDSEVEAEEEGEGEPDRADEENDAADRPYRWEGKPRRGREITDWAHHPQPDARSNRMSSSFAIRTRVCSVSRRHT